MKMLLLTTLALIDTVAASPSQYAKRQDGPVDFGVTPDCTFYDNAYTKEDGCQLFASNWQISREDFIVWNPSVGEDCQNIIVGHSYCVEAKRAKSTATSTATSTSTSSATSSAGPSGPSPTQAGIIKTCTSFYKAVPGDSCHQIVDRHGTFGLDEFLQWNPAVGAGCTRLLADFYYCVGIPGTPAEKLRCPVVGPQPQQPWITRDCKNYYKVQAGDVCQTVIDKYGTFSQADFQTWNPGLGSNCQFLWAEYYVCVGVVATPTSKPKPTGPSPTQPGIISSCDKYHKAVSGDTCQVIAENSGIQLSDFYAWNPAAKTDCSGLWAGYYYCVGIPYAFRVQSLYHAECTGATHNDVTLAVGSSGMCIDTGCQTASLNIDAAGNCPDGQVQISYWEQPGCQGKWFGYGYSSRGS